MYTWVCLRETVFKDSFLQSFMPLRKNEIKTVPSLMPTHSKRIILASMNMRAWSLTVKTSRKDSGRKRNRKAEACSHLLLIFIFHPSFNHYLFYLSICNPLINGWMELMKDIRGGVKAVRLRKERWMSPGRSGDLKARTEWFTFLIMNYGP